jgi:hypothetical protein
MLVSAEMHATRRFLTDAARLSAPEARRLDSTLRSILSRLGYRGPMWLESCVETDRFRKRARPWSGPELNVSETLEGRARRSATPLPTCRRKSLRVDGCEDGPCSGSAERLPGDRVEGIVFDRLQASATGRT